MLISDDQLKQWWCEGGKLIKCYLTTHLNTLSFSLQSCGVQFYKRLTNLCCLLSTVFIHPSIYSNSTSITSYCLQ
ncbi:hypothetical protein Pcinc_014274 [Petrolisthes cinctipes]|uniref:Uncharacterized protein n=1 Tax=Petrolisthes cinctipes TaxID=88211 RepID=A0AAE1KRJ1_PETCI|nr:hypothetical protein Pcinc_014274 [Petrolisthes cinctipes]